MVKTGNGCTQGRLRAHIAQSDLQVLIDQLANTLSQYQDTRNGILFIDSRGTLSMLDGSYMQDWDNELHPTGSGFDKIVDQHWIQTLQNIGMTMP